MPRKLYIAERVANFGGDATPVAMMRFNNEWADLNTVLKHLTEIGPLYAPVTNNHTADGQIVITIVRERHAGFVDNYRPGELEYLLPTLQSGSNNSSLYVLPTSVYPAERGYLMLLMRLASESGLSIQAEIVDRLDFARYVGEPSLRDGLVPGKLIGCPGLKIWVEQA